MHAPWHISGIFLPGTSNRDKWSSECIQAVFSYRENHCDLFTEDWFTFSMFNSFQVNHKGNVGRIAYDKKR